MDAMPEARTVRSPQVSGFLSFGYAYWRFS
jgi:hypothetical protein